MQWLQFEVMLVCHADRCHNSLKEWLTCDCLVYMLELFLQVAVQQQKPETLLAPVHLLAILLTEDKGRGSASPFVRNVQDAGQQ